MNSYAYHHLLYYCQFAERYQDTYVLRNVMFF